MIALAWETMVLFTFSFFFGIPSKKLFYAVFFGETSSLDVIRDLTLKV